LVVPTHVVQVVAAIGAYQQVFKRSHGKLGDLVVMDTVFACATGVRTGLVLVADSITQKLFQLKQVVNIQSVLEEFIDAAQENV
tara:strand:- start:264 stop:515 length:252 start_codon:yes stop_codon:yes gene_type:complete